MNNNIKIKKNFDINNMIKITNINDDTTKHADLILKNTFVLSSNLDYIDFKDSINWDYTHHVSANTYKLYLHSFHPVSLLCNAFELTTDYKYINKALDIAFDWNHFQLNNNHFFTWYDHSSASRTIVLSYLYLLINKYKVETDILTVENMLIENIDFLYSDIVYRRHNHGIMMDRALIQAGMLFNINNDKLYVSKGLFRLKDNFYHSFSSKATHLENSPEYHKVTYDLFMDVESFLQKFELSLGDDIILKLNYSNSYYNYITKPDGFLPLIGDTKKMKAPYKKKSYNSFLDYEAGIAILQSENQKKKSNSTWLSFVAGYSTLTHKHYDDLSFTLYHNGSDIFVDSGKHSYGGSDIRKYIRSSLAHNTVVINNRNYSFLEPLESKGKIHISDFSSNEIYDFVKGVNFGYKNTEITRSIILIKTGTIIILDKIRSDKKQKISQIFNLAPHITSINGNKSSCTIKSCNDNILIEQFNDVDELNIYNGHKDDTRAFISETIGKTININQLEYTKHVKNDFFLTVITLNKNSNVNNIQFNQNVNLLSFDINSFSFSIII